MRRGVLARRVFLVASSLTFLVIILGCMSFSIGGGHQEVVSGEDGTSRQSGEMKLLPGQELDVYYPVPFASPPNLAIYSERDSCVLEDQHPDHFRVRNRSAFTEELTWRARGLKAGAPAVAVPAPSPPAGPPAPVGIGPPAEQPKE